MLKWKKALSLFAAVCVLLACLTTGAFAAERPSVYEIWMTAAVAVDGLDDTYYTVYSRALAVPVGEENSVTRFMTDASITWPMSVIEKTSASFSEMLSEKKLTVSQEDLADLITMEKQMYHLYDGENWISVDLSYTICGTNAAIFAVQDDSAAVSGAVPAVFATGVASGDAVSNFALNTTQSELFGVVEGDMDLTTSSIVAQNGSVTHLTAVSQESLPYSAIEDTSSDGKLNAYMANITRTYGAIGSPLLNAKNEVIGITTYDAEKDVTLAISSDEAARHLASMEIISTDIPEETDASSNTASNSLGGIGVSSSDAETDSDMEKLANIIKYAIFVAVGLVVILIVLLIVRLRRGGNEEEYDEADLEEQYAQRQREMRKRHQERHSQVLPKIHTEESASAMPNIRPAVRPVRPVQKEEEPVEQTVAPAVEAAPKVPANPVVSKASAAPAAAAASVVAENGIEKAEFVTMTIVSGKKKGYSQKVDGRIVIGRDPSTCKMLFPASDTTISRTHCVLTYIPTTGDIVLEDLGSANGTYSASGRRLIPGKKYRVRLGDKFYLGTAENMIEVK